jgi:DNA-binding SARP family transcriptional activator/Flp pilus assembly protein TadD
MGTLLTIETLGRAAAHTAGGARVSAPRRLALLGILAAAGQRGVSRDKVLAYLWPESPPEKARHALEQLLYGLRREAGGELFLNGNPLRLDPGATSSDVDRFEDALALGDLERAVNLYAGPFLDGFFVGDASEFERWVEVERSRLAKRYADALELLAKAASARGDHERAAEWWRRRAESDFYDSRVALELMRAHVAAGNPAGALLHAQAHESLLRQDLDAVPHASVSALAEQLRAMPRTDRPTGVASRVTPAHPPVQAADVPKHMRARATIGLAGNQGDRFPTAAESPETLFGGRPAPQHRALRWPVLASVVTAVIAATSFGIAAFKSRADKTGSANAVTPYRVAVFPFAVQARAESQYLGEGLMDLTGQAIDGVGDLRRVDPYALMSVLRRQGPERIGPAQAQQLAARFGAGRWVLGSVVDADGELQLSMSLYDASLNGEPAATARARGSYRQLEKIVNIAIVELLSNQRIGIGGRLANVPIVQTKSFDALKAYLRGEALLRRGYADAAHAAFSEAVRADSGFALAWYRRSWTQYTAAGPSLRMHESIQPAIAHADRLSERDRLLALTLEALWHGDSDRAADLARMAVGRYPEQVEAWWMLGVASLRSRWSRGEPGVGAREAFEHALALDPGNPDIRFRLGWIATWERRYAAAESLLHRGPTRAPQVIESHKAILAFARGAVDSAVRALATKEDVVVVQAAYYVALYTDSLDGARRIAAMLTDTTKHAQAVQGLGHLLTAHVELAAGRRVASRRDFAKAAATFSTISLMLRAFFAVSPFFPRAAAELTALRDTLLHSRPDIEQSLDQPFGLRVPAGLRPHLRDYLLGLVNARLGDSAAATGYASRLERARASQDSVGLLADLALEVRALVAAESGRPAEALSILEREGMRVGHIYGVFDSPFHTRPYGRFLRAELLYRLGRDAEAFRWYESFGHIVGPEFVHASPAQYRMGQIEERRGHVREAVERYDRFIARWRGAEADLQPPVEDARRRVARLRPRVRPPPSLAR